MKFTIVRLNCGERGIPIIWRGGQQNTYQLNSAEGWRCEATEHGVMAMHDSRAEPLFVPWALVGPCDVAADAKGVKKAS